MTVSNSKGAYQDCHDLFERAKHSKHGLIIHQPTFGLARLLQTRLHKARTLLREESRMIFEPGDPGYDISPYDDLIVRQPTEEGDRWLIKIEKRQYEVEEIAAE